MSATPHGGLQMEGDPAFQRRMWRVERVGWVVLAILVAATVAGLIAPGPLSHRTTGTPGSAIWVEYDGLGQVLRPTTARVHLRAPPADHEAELVIDGRLLDRMEVQGIVPEPLRTEGGPDSVRCVFRCEEPGGSITVRVQLRPQKPGVTRGWLRSGGERVEMKQFVTP